MADGKLTDIVVGSTISIILFAGATFFFSLPAGLAVGIAYADGRFKIIKKIRNTRKQQKKLKP